MPKRIADVETMTEPISVPLNELKSLMVIRLGSTSRAVTSRMPTALILAIVVMATRMVKRELRIA